MIVTLCIESDVNEFGYSSSSSVSSMDVTMVLTTVESCWSLRVLCNQGIYGSALQIKAQAKSSAFTAAVNQAIQSELQKLDQNRRAKSSMGNNGGSTPKTGTCFDCGKTGRHRGDSSRPNSKGQSTGHRLDAVNTKCINLLEKNKFKEYSNIATVPDG
jgi:hypothetical protein